MAIDITHLFCPECDAHVGFGEAHGEDCPNHPENLKHPCPYCKQSRGAYHKDFCRETNIAMHTQKGLLHIKVKKVVE